jgi:hypothetical protein
MKLGDFGLYFVTCPDFQNFNVYLGLSRSVYQSEYYRKVGGGALPLRFFSTATLAPHTIAYCNVKLWSWPTLRLLEIGLMLMPSLEIFLIRLFLNFVVGLVYYRLSYNGLSEGKKKRKRRKQSLNLRKVVPRA